jgi:hypothetical protein
MRFRDDLFGGLISGALAIPLAMGYGDAEVSGPKYSRSKIQLQAEASIARPREAGQAVTETTIPLRKSRRHPEFPKARNCAGFRLYPVITAGICSLRNEVPRSVCWTAILRRSCPL